MGANLDNSALPGVYCAVVMGRHAGFLTAASALARKFPGDGPHLIYLPERTFAIDEFLADVKASYDKHGRCIIAASEGIHDEHGAPIIAKLADKLEKDAHGNVQLSGTGALADLLCEEIKAKLGIKRVRGDTFGYLQRSFVGCVSDVDSARSARSRREGGAVRDVGGPNGSVAIRRVGEYAVDYPLIPLETVAGKTRVMEDAFIAASATTSPPRSTITCARCSARICPRSPGCERPRSPRVSELSDRRAGIQLQQIDEREESVSAFQKSMPTHGVQKICGGFSRIRERDAERAQRKEGLLPIVLETTENKGVRVNGSDILRSERGSRKMAQIRGDDRGRAAINRRRRHVAIVGIRQCDQFDGCSYPTTRASGNAHPSTDACARRACGPDRDVSARARRPFVLNPRGPVRAKHAEQCKAHEQVAQERGI